MPANDELLRQVEQEQQELIAAPIVSSSGIVGRCHWCGAIGGELRYVETVGDPPVERYRGVACCGG